MKNVLMKKSAVFAAAMMLLFNVPASVLAADSEAANVTSGLPKIDYKQLKEAFEKASKADAEQEPSISPGLNTKSAGSVNVIVQFSKEPVVVSQYGAKLRRQAFSAQTVTQGIQQQQAAFVSASKAKGVSVKVNRKFNTVLNGMEVTVPADKIPTLASLPGVVSISENLTYYPLAADGGAAVMADPVYDDAPLKQIGVDEAWAMGYTGAGMKVAVLDTGVDYYHPDLTIAGGYDSFYQDDDPYEEPPLTPMEDELGIGFEGTQHGTHVSGTIAGRARNGAASQVQKGVAYDADLYVYKVLGRTSDGKVSGSSATIIDGIERAVKAGVDVINMSLGADENKNPNSPDSIAVNNAVLHGVTVVVANGNAATQGPYYYSMGTPSAAQLAFSVGAATSPSTIPIYSANVSHQISGAAPSEAKPLKLAQWKTGQEDFAALFGTDPINAVYVGLGKDSDYKNVNVTGKIAFISRGDIAFTDKVAFAKKHGALAVIMFNGNSKKVGGVTVPDLTEDQPGRNGLIGLDGGPGADNIPTFDMTGVEGRSIARELTSTSGKTLSFTFEAFNSTENEGDQMGDFSSRGPNSDGNFSIKPDLVAPGVNIYSTWPEYGKFNSNANYSEAYMRESGTSMATPHVAGLALLVKEAHPDWGPLDIRAALDNTSESIYDPSGTLYDVYSQGSGRVNVAKAIETPALLKAMDNITIYDNLMNATTMPSEAGSVSFGLVDAGSPAVSKPLELENMSGNALTYSAHVSMHLQVTSDPDPIRSVPTPDVSKIDMTLSGLGAGDTVTVSPNGKADFTLIAEANPDAKAGVYEGEVVLESAGVPTLHLPFVIHVGEDSDPTEWGVTDIRSTDVVAAPDHPIDVTANLNAKDIQQILLVAFSPESDACIVSTMYDEELTTIAPGPLKFEQIDGSCIGTDERVDDEGNFLIGKLDGFYELAIMALHVDKATGEADFDHAQVAYTSVKFSSGSIGNPGGENPGGGDPGNENPGGGDPGNGNPGGGNPGGGNPGGGSPGGGSPGGGSPGGGGSGGNTGNDTPQSNGGITPTVFEQGQSKEAAEVSMKLEGQELIASVTNEGLKKAIDNAKQSPVAITMSTADKDSTGAQLQLTPAQVNLLRQAPANSSIVFTWNEASSVAFPLSVLAGLSEGAALNIHVEKNANAKSGFQAAYPEADILGEAYTFEADIVLNGKTTPVDFKPEQSFKRSFLIAQAVNPASAGVLYEEDGKVSPVAATFQAASGGTIVTIDRPGFSTYAVAKRQVAFSDIGNSWAKDHIQTLANAFLLNGTSAGKFEPKADVTRAQFASMLVRGLGLQKAAASAPFSDVTAKDWFAQDVAAAYAAGLVTGGADGSFHPNAPISRQDLTVMLARAAELLKLLKPAGTHKPYTDMPQISAYAEESVQTVSDLGLMEGYQSQGGIAFDPQGETSREAVAKVLHSLLQAAGLIQ
ncbi:S8 family serine peptidase [Paenibacillus sp. NFR01]|uniref:S8 family serine peptidase n=1 Tax=Paenibacillus sp. NFR01 TaxID=1566279 RepID=UPI0008C67088|nr:S8 family serine peptidase [Paenibacillus sp. NFR01]SEU27614.1 S-layer homology domain-containing protein [Paenibacillus sp. NFR01]